MYVILGMVPVEILMMIKFGQDQLPTLRVIHLFSRQTKQKNLRLKGCLCERPHIFSPSVTILLFRAGAEDLLSFLHYIVPVIVR